LLPKILDIIDKDKGKKMYESIENE